MFPFGQQQQARSPRSLRPVRPPRPPRPRPFMQQPQQLNLPSQSNNQQKGENNPSLISMFQTSEGNIDFEKISGTVQQIGELYGTFSPMLSKFIKR